MHAHSYTNTLSPKLTNAKEPAVKKDGQHMYPRNDKHAQRCFKTWHKSKEQNKRPFSSVGCTVPAHTHTLTLACNYCTLAFCHCTCNPRRCIIKLMLPVRPGSMGARKCQPLQTRHDRSKNLGAQRIGVGNELMAASAQAQPNTARLLAWMLTGSK